ncbi:MAG: Gfo/Idh/MocA family oxidoreductase [Planctomycetes bacterium]|nr:Gfo/Idh/MocA family oxidoreductase [Planctomycetota bacterium]
MPKKSDRRDFLKTSAAVGAGFWIAGGVQTALSKSPNEKIQVACFGIHGKGRTDSMNAEQYGKVVAVCDVDRLRLKLAAKQFKTEHTATDFRELLDKMGDRVDAVMVSTPDHNHAVIAAKAMKMGKHVYCQKPLTHTIWEARRLGEIARETGVVTQMGNQFTAYNPMRKAAYQLRAGQVGAVKEVHIWTNRPVWPQGEGRKPEKPVPKNLDWEAWIGRAPFRPFADGYHPFAWRGWWDFGTGALGDMACHTSNLPFMGLNMRDPTSVEAEHSGHDGDSYPSSSKIVYEFPELDGRSAFRMTWYDGGNLPPQELFDEFKLTVKRGPLKIKPDTSGVLIIGDQGKMYAAGDYADHGVEIVGAEELNVDYPVCPGPDNADERQKLEWFTGMHDPSKQPTSNFADYAGPLTETILLGNLAVYKGGRVEWDAKNLKADDPDLQRIVKPVIPDGYEV